MAEDLRRALKADSLVQSGFESAAEPVFFHFESVRRLAASEKPFKLEKYYAATNSNLGDTFSTTIGNLYVKCVLPAGSTCVRMVDNFDDVSRIISLLTGGFIVVSKNPSQNGIEYLTPFHDATSSRLVAIGGVQVKYVTNGTSSMWKDIHGGAVDALSPFTEAGKYAEPAYHTFPVFITTTDQCGGATAKDLMTDGVLLLESATFHWTQPLGILRLHVEKLGTVLAEEVPMLSTTVGCLPIEDPAS